MFTVPTSEYRECRLCPRQCGVDREAGETGVCRESSVCRIASAEPHFGEEPSFSGRRGSGTIFFSGCSSRCFFCQNHRISIENEGRTVSPDEFLRLALRLIDDGVHNLNFVTPDHFWPHVEALCRALRSRGILLPFLFNSSGYQDADMTARYAEWMDIFLPDFKFADPDLAARCMGDARYPEIALRAITRMIECKGFLLPWDPTGAQPATVGVLVRHLVLPGQIDNSLRALRLLREEFGSRLPLSVMSQFAPVPPCARAGDLDRPVTREEYDRVCREVEDLGFVHVYLQPDRGDAAFLPDFDLPHPFAGNR